VGSDGQHHFERARELNDDGALEHAVEECRKAIALDADLAVAHDLLGCALAQLGDHTGALAAFDNALRVDPDFVLAHCNRSLELLYLGDYARGWQEFEWRWRRPEYQMMKGLFSRGLWDGSDLRGRTILLFAEQGLGDAVQFVRYAPLIAEKGAKVVLDCHPPLKRLFRSVAGVTHVLEGDAEIANYDLCAPLMGLPRMLGTTLQTIPVSIPYLNSPPDQYEKWRERLKSSRDSVRVGLVWACNPEAPGAWRRSVPPDMFAPLGAVRGATFFSLQIGSGHGNAAELVGGLPLWDMTDELWDFRDTAAFIANLDLVVTVDTMFAQLAGALGTPTWVLLSPAADWRWGMGGERTPWYPAMQLFRQGEGDDWTGVIERLVRELRKYTKVSTVARS